MRPRNKRSRDLKCVQVEPRKRVKSASPEARIGSGESDTTKRPGLLACPYYKHDPTQYMECLLRNRLKSTSFVRQHLLRVHCQPTHCSRCGHEFEKESELEDHVRRLVRCKVKPVSYPGLNMDQLMKIRKPSRDLDEQGRWNSMWQILFPGEPCPEDPYVGSAQEEILGIARRAVEAAGLDTPPQVLQLLNWDSVSTIYTRRSADKTTPPSSQDSWPLTPESMDGDAPEATNRALVRTRKGHSTKGIHVPTAQTLDSANTYLGSGFGYGLCLPNEFLSMSDDTDGTSEQMQRATPFFLPPPGFPHSTPSSSPCNPEEIFLDYENLNQTWLSWSEPSVALSTSSCGSQDFIPLVGPEVIDLTH